MPTDDQTVHYPFAMGVDELTDEKHVDPPKLVTASNVVFNKDGALEKRDGSTAISGIVSNSGSGSVTMHARRFESHGDSLIAFDTNYLNDSTLASIGSRSESADRFTIANDFPLIDVDSKIIVDDIAYNRSGDSVCLTSGTTVNARLYAWTRWATGSTYDLYYAVYDSTSGAVIVPPTKISTEDLYSDPKLSVTATTGAVAFLTYIDASGNLKCRRLATPWTGGSWTSATDIATAASLAAFTCYGHDIDVVGATNSEKVYIAAIDATNQLIRYLVFNTSLTYQHGGSEALAFAALAKTPCAISADPTGTSYMIAYADNRAAVKAKVMLKSDSTTVTASATVLSGVGRTTYSVGLQCHQTNSSYAMVVGSLVSSMAQTTFSKVSTALATSSTLTGYNTEPWSKPVWQGSCCYAVTSFLGDPTSTVDEPGSVYLSLLYQGAVTMVAPQPAAYLAMRTVPSGYASPAWSSTVRPFIGLPRFSLDTSSRALIVLPHYSDVTNSTKRGLADYTFTLDHMSAVEAGQMAQLGGLSLVSGALPTVYDGARAWEAGFAWNPVNITFTAGNAGVAAILQGTYSYAIVAERRFNDGSVQRSAPYFQVGLSVTTNAAQNKVTIVAQCIGLTLTSSTTSIRFVLYRTTLADTTTYKRMSIEPAYVSITNDQTAATVTFVDTSPDSDIASSGVTLASRPQVYTTGVPGETLVDLAPPHFQCVMTHDDRWWGASGNVIWPSQPYVPGIVPGFHEDTRIFVQDADKITAMASMDGRAVLFSDSAIYAVTGSGAAPNGDGGSYSSPNQLHASVGCVNNRAFAAFPDGIAFLSPEGKIHLLNRGLSLEYISGPVSTTLATYPTCLASVWVPKKQEVRFVMAGSLTATTGVELVYNVRNKQWTTFSRYGASTAGVSLKTAAVANGTYYFAVHPTTVGYAYKDDSTSFYDDTVTATRVVSYTVKTGWFKPAGIQGYASLKRVQVLAHALTLNDVQIKIYKDYSTTASQTSTYVEILGTATGVRQYDVHVADQKGEAWQVEFIASYPTDASAGTGQGPRLEGITFVAGVRRSTMKLPAARKT